MASLLPQQRASHQSGLSQQAFVSEPAGSVASTQSPKRGAGTVALWLEDRACVFGEG